ncbi:MAG: hypothetical protein ABF746_07085 [Acetobacter orientalis]|uniref:hypothetical protein n=1 Tax=Acetobacter orientalis TaxID=146474 RepID=UPI0039E89DEF
MKKGAISLAVCASVFAFSSQIFAAPMQQRTPLDPTHDNTLTRPYNTESLNNKSLATAHQTNAVTEQKIARLQAIEQSKSADAVIAEGTGLSVPPIAVTPALPENFYGHISR